MKTDAIRETLYRLEDLLRESGSDLPKEARAELEVLKQELAIAREQVEHLGALAQQAVAEKELAREDSTACRSILEAALHNETLEQAMTATQGWASMSQTQQDAAHVRVAIAELREQPRQARSVTLEDVVQVLEAAHDDGTLSASKWMDLTGRIRALESTPARVVSVEAALLERMKKLEEVLVEIHNTPWQAMSLDQRMDIDRKVQRLVGLKGAP